MHPPVLVLNGASSSGKTALGRAVQRQLGPGWFLLGADDLLRALMPEGDDAALLDVGSDGSVHVSEAFRRAEAAWYAGLAALARHAQGLVVDEVLLGGGTSQARLAEALAGLPVVWVAVVCDLAVGRDRERARGDRVLGMHAQQRDRVHDGVAYDVVVDTTSVTADVAARDLLRGLREAGRLG